MQAGALVPWGTTWTAGGELTMSWPFLIMVMMLVAPGIIKARRQRLDKDQGVLASWERLRITRTELIEGYKRTAQRRPLTGLTARVDDVDGKVRVIVEGPGATIVESHRLVKVGYLIPRNVTDAAAKFVTAFNSASEMA
jgi:hypothetical protein